MIEGPLTELAAAASLTPGFQNAFLLGIDLGALVGPAVIAAAVSGIVATIGFLVNRNTSLTMHKQKLAADEKLAERKFELDKALAERKFSLDTKIADRKRKQDLAETVLAGFYEVEAIMRMIRSPMTSVHEAEGRQRADGESEATKRLRDTYYVYIARYDRRRAEIAALTALRYRMSAWFGAEADKPFQELHEAIVKVITAAGMLVEWSKDPEGFRHNNLELWQKMERAIGWGTQDEDTVAQQINKAIVDIEAICRPILQEVVNG